MFTAVSILQMALFQRRQVPREDSGHRWLRGQGGRSLVKEVCDSQRQSFSGETVAAWTQESVWPSLAAGLPDVLRSLKRYSGKSLTLQWSMLANNSYILSMKSLDRISCRYNLDTVSRKHRCGSDAMGVQTSRCRGCSWQKTSGWRPPPRTLPTQQQLGMPGRLVQAIPVRCTLVAEGHHQFSWNFPGSVLWTAMKLSNFFFPFFFHKVQTCIWAEGSPPSPAPSHLELKGMCAQSLNHVWLFVTPWTIAHM